MFFNMFKTALRTFIRNKTFSIVNVLGLSIGISAALVMFLIVYHEYSFDRFAPGAGRIYRVVIDAKFNGTEGHSAGVQAPLSDAIQREMNGIELTVPVMQFQGDATANVAIPTQRGEAVVYKKQQGVVFTNNHYFQLLAYHFVAGAPATALAEPFAVVLTKSRARQYFPNLQPAQVVGRQITYNDELRTTIAGVVDDLAHNSSLSNTDFISFATIAKTHLQDNFMMNVWNDWMAYSQVYIKLDAGTRAATTELQLNKLLLKYNKEAYRDEANYFRLHLQPLSDIHFNGNYPGVGQRVANRSTLRGLLAIAAFLLLLGCINFINLTTAQSGKRAKEIGIRKTLGSSKKQLIWQFLCETFFITTLATFFSVVLTPLLLYVFADLLPPGLHFNLLQQPWLMLFLLVLVIAVSLLAGIYPALIISGYRPVLVLKSQAYVSAGQTRSAWVRKTLTVTQFVIAQVFIIGTLIVSKQINYGLHADLGFQKDAIVTFQLPNRDTTGNAKYLLQQVRSVPGVQMASAGFLSPANVGVAFTNVTYPPHPNIGANIQIRWGDTAYLRVYGIHLLAGRNVQPSDTIREFIINEALARLLGFQNPANAINQNLVFNNKNVPIVGVMQNFHDQSMHMGISPLVFGGSSGTTFHVRLQPNTPGSDLWPRVINQLGAAYHKSYPQEEFSYTFFDETLASMYQSEIQTARLLRWATGLAILISCLGLLALVIFVTTARTREIGIRKILGASVAAIVSILSTGFMGLVLLAFIIAAPIAWWASDQWLQNFAYRTPISWWVFALSGAGMLLLALLTLSVQTIRAAVVNPVKSLRTE